MPPKRITAFSGGWSAAKANEVRCARCHKWKAQDAYSKKQLTDLRHFIAVKGPSAPTTEVKCRLCTGGQVTELQCAQCDEWKGLDDFAKAQRSKADKAKCLKCMEKQLAVEPEDTDPESDSDDESLPEIDGIDDSYLAADTANDGVSLTKLSLNDTTSIGENTKPSASVTEKLASSTAGTFTADGFLEQPQGKRVIAPSSRPSGSATPNASGSVSAVKPFDPNAYRSPKRPASVAGTTASYSAASVKTGRGGWAKPPRGPTQKKEDSDDEEKKSSNWPSDEEDDDEEYGKL